MNAVTYQSAFLDRHSYKKEKDLFNQFESPDKKNYGDYLVYGNKGFDDFKKSQNFSAGRSELDKKTLAYDRAGVNYDLAKNNLEQFLLGKENSAFTQDNKKTDQVSFEDSKDWKQTNLGTKNPEAKQSNALLNDIATSYLGAYIGGLLAPYLKDSAEKTSVEGVGMQNKMPAFLPNAGMGGNSMSKAAEDRNERLYQQRTKMGSLFTGLT